MYKILLINQLLLNMKINYNNIINVYIVYLEMNLIYKVIIFLMINLYHMLFLSEIILILNF